MRDDVGELVQVAVALRQPGGALGHAPLQFLVQLRQPQLGLLALVDVLDGADVDAAGAAIGTAMRVAAQNDPDLLSVRSQDPGVAGIGLPGLHQAVELGHQRFPVLRGKAQQQFSGFGRRQARVPAQDFVHHRRPLPAVGARVQPPVANAGQPLRIAQLGLADLQRLLRGLHARDVFHHAQRVQRRPIATRYQRHR